MSIYVCGDIHGQYELYRNMLEDIHFSDSDRLYIIGDMIDRGADGIEILRDVMERPNVTCLIGNHELMMYDYITSSGKSGDYWSSGNNGGSVTREAYYSLRPREREAIRNYLRSLYLQLELELGDNTYLLSHSSFLPKKKSVRWQDIPYFDTYNTVWDSPWRTMEYVSPQTYKKDGRIHIIGHVPVQRIYAYQNETFTLTSKPEVYIDKENRIINIDYGCAGYNRNQRHGWLGLCCMNLSEYTYGDPEKAFSYYY